MERLKGDTRVAVCAADSPETSVIFNSPGRRVTVTTPAVLIISDISTSYSGRQEVVGGLQRLLVGGLYSCEGTQRKTF